MSWRGSRRLPRFSIRITSVLGRALSRTDPRRFEMLLAEITCVERVLVIGHRAEFAACCKWKRLCRALNHVGAEIQVAVVIIQRHASLAAVLQAVPVDAGSFRPGLLYDALAWIGLCSRTHCSHRSNSIWRCCGDGLRDGSGSRTRLCSIDAEDVCRHVLRCRTKIPGTSVCRHRSDADSGGSTAICGHGLTIRLERVVPCPCAVRIGQYVSRAGPRPLNTGRVLAAQRSAVGEYRASVAAPRVSPVTDKLGCAIRWWSGLCNGGAGK